MIFSLETRDKFGGKNPTSDILAVTEHLGQRRCLCPAVSAPLPSELRLHLSFRSSKFLLSQRRPVEPGPMKSGGCTLSLEARLGGTLILHTKKVRLSEEE